MSRLPAAAHAALVWLSVALSLVAAPLNAQSVEPGDAVRGTSVEARAFFNQGNREYARARRLRGQARQDALARAMQAYASSLAIVRSRNALFNAAVVLEELSRPAEAYRYYDEYLAFEDLSAEDRAVATARQEALVGQVAMLRITSEPPGATVHLERGDSVQIGVTPLTVAVAPGAHTVLLTLPHHERAAVETDAPPGVTTDVQHTMVGTPVPLTVHVDGEAIEGARLTIDGVAARSGVPQRVAPGEHRVAVIAGERHVERTLVLEPGGAGEITLTLPPPPPPEVVVAEPLPEPPPPAPRAATGSLGLWPVVIWGGAAAMTGLSLALALRSDALTDEHIALGQRLQTDLTLDREAREAAVARGRDLYTRSRRLHRGALVAGFSAGAMGIAAIITTVRRVREPDADDVAFDLGVSRGGAVARVRLRWGAP